MIPRGRPALTEADIASEKEMNLKTWQRNESESLRARVPLVNEGGRLRLYDEEQVRAYLSGSTWPPGQRDHDVAAGADDADTTWPPAVPPG